MRKMNIRKIMELLAGNAMMAIAIAAAVSMNDHLGGTSGLASILAKRFDLPLNIMVLFVNGLLFMIGWIFLGTKTAIKSAGSVIMFPLFLSIAESSNYAFLKRMHPFLSAVLDGLILGISVYLILDAGASTGGFDIPGLILKKRTGMNPSVIMGIGDVAVILLQSDGLSMGLVCGIIISTATAFTSAFLPHIFDFARIAKRRRSIICIHG